MARILVAGKGDSIAGRDLLRRITARLDTDGHDAAVVTDDDPQKAIVECDAVVAVLDDAGAPTCTTVAYAASLRKPVLGFSSEGQDCGALLRRLCDVQVGSGLESWMEHLPAFYDKIRPFAGRVVRDRIPQLVKEAGHEVKFRELTGEEKPRFLKQKVAHEASELQKADLAKEKEEVADVLEALEAFIVARGFDRDDLRRVKEAKKKRRGGFDRCFVVEATSMAATDATEPEKAGDVSETEGSIAQAAAETPKAAEDPGFEYPEEDPAPADEPLEDLAPDKQVKSGFFEL